MILEEAIKNREDCLKYLEECGPKASPECVEAVRWSVKALKALRPVSRERVEKVWRGEWIIGEPDGLGVPIHCSRCGWGSDHADPRKWMNYGGHIFCGYCGAPMTDEAVQMVMERLEVLHDKDV